MISHLLTLLIIMMPQWNGQNVAIAMVKDDPLEIVTKFQSSLSSVASGIGDALSVASSFANRSSHLKLLIMRTLKAGFRVGSMLLEIGTVLSNWTGPEMAAFKVFADKIGDELKSLNQIVSMGFLGISIQMTKIHYNHDVSIPLENLCMDLELFTEETTPEGRKSTFSDFNSSCSRHNPRHIMISLSYAIDGCELPFEEELAQLLGAVIGGISVSGVKWTKREQKETAWEVFEFATTLPRRHSWAFLDGIFDDRREGFLFRKRVDEMKCEFDQIYKMDPLTHCYIYNVALKAGFAYEPMQKLYAAMIADIERVGSLASLCALPLFNNVTTIASRYLIQVAVEANHTIDKIVFAMNSALNASFKFEVNSTIIPAVNEFTKSGDKYNLPETELRVLANSIKSNLQQLGLRAYERRVLVVKDYAFNDNILTFFPPDSAAFSRNTTVGKYTIVDSRSLNTSTNPNHIMRLELAIDWMKPLVVDVLHRNYRAADMNLLVKYIEEDHGIRLGDNFTAFGSLVFLRDYQLKDKCYVKYGVASVAGRLPITQSITHHESGVYTEDCEDFGLLPFL